MLVEPEEPVVPEAPRDPFANVPPEVQAAFAAEATRYLVDLGYEPLPHVVDVAPDHRVAIAPTSIGALEATFSRERVAAIVSELADIDPAQLEFDPFVGELRDVERPDTLAILAVVRAEAFVRSVRDTAIAVNQYVAGLEAELGPSRAAAADRLRPLHEERTRVMDNVAHARSHLAAMDADQERPSEDPVRQRYGLDALVAESQLRLLDVRLAHGDLDESVTAMSVLLGNVAASVNVGLARSAARTRRLRRMRRAIRRGLLAVLVAAVGLLLGTIVDAVWAFVGSMVLAGLTLAVDPLIDHRVQDWSRRRQVGALIEAVQASGRLVDSLLSLEVQVNSVRAMHGLPAVAFVERKLLRPPA